MRHLPVTTAVVARWMREAHTPDLPTCLAQAMDELLKAERERIAALIRQRADEAKGKAWYHPQIELEGLAETVERLI